MQEFVSKLTPAQIKLQQAIVEEHVNKEAAEKNLNEAQTALLLSQTLEHNGLPQISLAPSKIGFVDEYSPTTSDNVLDSVISGVSDVINNIVGIGGDNSADVGDDTPGLPKPGTLSHTLTLGLLRAQQAANKVVTVISNPSTALTNIREVATNYITGQPAAEDKIGEAATDTETNHGILDSIPEMIGNILGGPTADIENANLPTHVTYSEVKTGIDPTYAALGVLTTGALLYSSGIASSATALAKGAVDAVKRNDLVSAATNAFSDDFAEKIEHDYTSYDYYEASDNSNYGPSGSYYDAAHPYYQEVDFRHLPYDQEMYQTKFIIYEKNSIPISEQNIVSPDVDYVKTEHVFKNIKPVYIPEVYRESSEEDNNTSESVSEPVKVNFFEPDANAPSVHFIAYGDQRNPWNIIHTDQNTNHLYH